MQDLETESIEEPLFLVAELLVFIIFVHPNQPTKPWNDYATPAATSHDP